jgi:hypothetical protein
MSPDGNNRGGPVFFPPVLVPDTASVDGEYILWGFPRVSQRFYEDQRPSLVRPTDKSVLSFSRLEDGVSVCQYAKRYGILWALQIDPNHARETDITLTDRTVWRLGDHRARVFAGSESTTDLRGKEPLGLWLSLAQRLRAVLRINAALKGRTRQPLPTPGSPEDWAVLGGGPPPEDLKDARFFLLREVNWWLAIGSVRLQLGIANFNQKRTSWKLDVAYDGLAGGLAYRLLLMVTGESNLYACDGCGVPYIRTKRAPRPGQENFCDDCADVAQKRATQRYREGKRS